MIVTACGAMLAQALIPLVTGRIIDGPIRHHDTAGIWPLAGLALAFGLAEAVLFFVRRYAMALGALGIETDMRRDLFAHLQRLPVAFHDRWASGQLLSRASTDLSTIRRFIGFGFVFLVDNTVTTLVVLGLLLSIDPPLGLLVVLAIAPLALFTRKFELRYSRDARRVQDLTGDLATSVEESALGIRVIKSYGRRPEMLESFTKDAAVLRRAELTKIGTLARFWAVLEGQPQLILAIVTCGGVLAAAHDTMTLGQLVAFLTLYLRLIWPIISLGWLLAITEEAASATRRLFDVLDTSPSIVDPPQPAARPRKATVRLHNVRFHYPDASEDVLQGVNLEIRDGETMALVGATGSGKTTLTELVPRLYDVTGGEITIGGVDVRDLALDDLRALVAVAFEDAPRYWSSTTRCPRWMCRPRHRSRRRCVGCCAAPRRSWSHTGRPLCCWRT